MSVEIDLPLGKMPIAEMDVPKGKTFMNHYSFARWYDKIETQEDMTIQVCVTKLFNGSVNRVAYKVPGLIIEDNHQGCFGGVPIGNGGINERVGQEMEVYESTYGFMFAEAVKTGTWCGMPIRMLPGFVYSEHPFESTDGRELIRHELSLEGVYQSHGSETGRYVTTEPIIEEVDR